MTTGSFASGVLRGLLALLVALSLTGRAWADSTDDTVAKITQLNKDAVAAYQAQKFEDARKLLKQGLDLADSAGLQQHPITARTHIHMGIVLIGGFKQRDLGIKQFKKALEIESTINLTKSLVTPEMTDAFNEAKSGAAAAPAAPPPTEEAPAPPAEAPPAETPPSAEAETPPPAAAAPEEGSSGLTHDPITEGKRGSAISVTVGVQPDLKFDKMILAYRPAGASEFLGRQMKEVSEGKYGAEIPTSATAGDSVAYYVEADDADGNAVANKGSADAPLVINLAGRAASKKPPEEGNGGGEEEEDEEPDHQYFVALLAGSGFGWATGPGDTNHDVNITPAGIAPAKLLQVAPEFGYWWSSSLMLSLQLRYQLVTGTVDPYFNGKDFKTANYAFAAFAKATWKFGDDDSSFHPFFSLAGGGGYIRHVVTLKPTHAPTQCGPMMNQPCVDTIAAGPILVGPGGGIFYDLTDDLSLVGQANAVLGFWNFTFNLDINVGLAYQF
ncbi:MAG TPA: tetratricopeptide repeat protein [Polyangia bacterium]|nr:tetratricopeptide repeat protein [Polyangia bacterium]